MKILMPCDTYFPEMGGGQVHVRELADRLEALGHQVRIFTNMLGATEDEHRVTRVAWRRNFRENYRKMDALCAEFKPDVIAGHYSYRLAMIAGFIGLRRRIPMTVTLHGLGTLPEAHASLRSRVQNWIYRRFSLTFATHVIATSQDMLDAVPWVAFKTTIVPNAADGRLYDPARWADEPSVRALREKYAGRKIMLTVRRLNPKCGIQYLVEAMPRIVKAHPDVMYVMVGTGRLEDAIRARVKELGLGEHVDMVGLVPNSETPKYFAIADVVIFPSTAESTSISCIEAMLMARAVAASRVGGLIELLGTDGTRGTLFKLIDGEHSDYEAPDVSAIPRERLDAMADAVSGFLSSPEARKRVGDEARRYALAHFDWDVIVKRTVKIYEDAVASLR